jgi:transposase
VVLPTLGTPSGARHPRRRPSRRQPRRRRARPSRPTAWHPYHRYHPGRLRRAACLGEHAGARGPRRRGRRRQLRRRARALAARPRPGSSSRWAGPTGPARRRRGKADDLDAHARPPGRSRPPTATGQPKPGDGTVEMIRSLRLARRSAVKARTQAANQLKALLVTAPDVLRARFVACRQPSWSRPRHGSKPPPSRRPRPTRPSSRWVSIARRWLQLTQEITALEVHLEWLVPWRRRRWSRSKGWAPRRPPRCWSRPGTIPSGCAVRPRSRTCVGRADPASSGKITRHRLNRGGNREANWALYLIAVGRMAWHGPTRAYVKRRTTKGKSKAEIIRCLKRHIARELYGVLASRPAT